MVLYLGKFSTFPPLQQIPAQMIKFRMYFLEAVDCFEKIHTYSERQNNENLTSHTKGSVYNILSLLTKSQMPRVLLNLVVQQRFIVIQLPNLLDLVAQIVSTNTTAVPGTINLAPVMYLYLQVLIFAKFIAQAISI
eukprot:SAG11_NODE_2098_length_3827_cov_2.481223_3_plen_136_part_00